MLLKRASSTCPIVTVLAASMRCSVKPQIKRHVPRGPHVDGPQPQKNRSALWPIRGGAGEGGLDSGSVKVSQHDSLCLGTAGSRGERPRAPKHGFWPPKTMLRHALPHGPHRDTDGAGLGARKGALLTVLHRRFLETHSHQTVQQNLCGSSSWQCAATSSLPSSSSIAAILSHFL
jgi:hypothetical protein